MYAANKRNETTIFRKLNLIVKKYFFIIGYIYLCIQSLITQKK